MTNVLVFPCGSEIGLEIHNALKYTKNVNLIGLTTANDHSEYVYKNLQYISTTPQDLGFVEEIKAKVKELNIDFIYPAHDSVVLALGVYDKGELGAKVMTSAKETVTLARSKSLTYEKLANQSFTPKTYTDEKAMREAEYPVFLKPDVGQGSVGIAIAYDYTELTNKMAAQPDLIAVEFLPGKEYTIDCFTDRHGELLFTGARVRNRIKSGISVNSYVVPTTEEIRQIAITLNEEIRFRGQWFFQVKEARDGSLKLLEIAPRVAGTMNLFRNKGVNFPQLSLFDFLETDVSILENTFDITVDRALINRHKLTIDYNTIYIDFDDTITLGEKINPKIMAFLFQEMNKQKKIILITRHNRDIHETLASLHLNESLFFKIIHITNGEAKSRYVTEKKSIFIDDSFKERHDVFTEKSIPVFDVDAVESLIDWRC